MVYSERRYAIRYKVRASLRSFGMLITVIISGSLGYRFIYDWSWLDAIYMTIISVTTVGFGELHPLSESERIYTGAMIIICVGLGAYALSSFTSMLADIEFNKYRKSMREKNKISKLSNHFIICGYGRIGREVSKNLLKEGIEHVIVDADENNLSTSTSNYNVLGDATADEVLSDAGIAKASGLVASLGSNADNVYLILTARQINPKLTIVSQASDTEGERKMLLAGSTYTYSPYVIGGARIAHQLISPHMVEFFDTLINKSINEHSSVEHLYVTDSYSMAGQSIGSIRDQEQLKFIVLTVKNQKERQHVPPRHYIPKVGDELLCMGPAADIYKLSRILGKPIDTAPDN